MRPRSDLIETLLHEMIHAFLFVTNNNTDHDGHGPNFHEHMDRINDEAGTNSACIITFMMKCDSTKCTGGVAMEYAGEYTKAGI